MLVTKCIYPKNIFAKCTWLAYLLSFGPNWPQYHKQFQNRALGGFWENCIFCKTVSHLIKDENFSTRKDDCTMFEHCLTSVGHLHVGSSSKLHGKLMDSITCPNWVRVPVYKTWANKCNFMSIYDVVTDAYVLHGHPIMLSQGECFGGVSVSTNETLSNFYLLCFVRYTQA